VDAFCFDDKYAVKAVAVGFVGEDEVGEDPVLSPALYAIVLPGDVAVLE
jgi:hypothetical protein